MSLQQTASFTGQQEMVPMELVQHVPSQEVVRLQSVSPSTKTLQETNNRPTSKWMSTPIHLTNLVNVFSA